ncbi:MAG: hypothetical protein J5923_06475 [Acidaminococcaceae bacterium]|nr:hypothetical protein [Acidaminococcaceae bacterium]
MNRIYKVIWNKARNCYMAVAEFVKRQGKSSSGLNRRHIGAALGNKTSASLRTGKTVAAALLAASVVCGVPGMAMANSGGTLQANGNYIGDAPEYTVTIDENLGNNYAIGRIETDAAASDANVSVVSGAEALRVYGGASENGSANCNTVSISGGTISDGGWLNSDTGRVFGGSSGKGSADYNTVLISGGTIGGVNGGNAGFGRAYYNTVYMSGGTVKEFVLGGWAVHGDANYNTVRINGGTIEGYVSGGGSIKGNVGNNMVILAREEGKEAPVLKGTLYGGTLTSGLYQSDSVSNNILQVEAVGLSAPEIQNFDTYKFVLPADSKAEDTMLKLKAQNAGLTIDGSRVSVSLAKGTLADIGLNLDESVTLLHETGGSGSFAVTNPQQLPKLEDKLDGVGFTTLVGKVRKPDGEDKLDFTLTEKYLYGEGGTNPVKGERHTGKTLNITDGVKATAAFGGRASSGDVTGNKVTMTGGEIVLLADSANPNYGISGNVYGGLVEAGNATGNEVTVSGGTVRGSAYGGYTNRTYMKAARNKVTITGGEVGDVYGGRVEDFDEIGSHLSYSIEPASAIENTVEIRGGIVNGDVYGGHSELGPAERNTVILAKEGKDAPSINGTLYGGYSSGGGRVSGNTLQVEAAGLTAPEIRNFENYKFVLPEDIKAGDTMLTLTRQDKNLTVDGSKVGITTDGRQNGLYLDESITLLEGPEGGFVEGGHYEFLINNYDKLPTLTQRLDDEATGFTTMVAKTEPVRGENKIRLTVSEKYLYGEGGPNPVKGERQTGNTLNITDGVKATAAFGGRATTGDVTGNKVTMSGGEIVRDSTSGLYAGNLYGGLAENGNAAGNVVTISGGTVEYNVYGGHSMLGSAERNMVILAKEAGKEAPTINGTVYGGFSPHGSVSDNTLQVEAAGLSAPEIQNFENYKFVLPADSKAGETMLKLTEQVGGLTIDGNKVSVTFHELNLKHGESVSLLSVENGQTISGSNLDNLWEQPFRDASPDNSVVLRGTESYRLSVDAAKTRLNYEIDHIAVDTVQLGTTDWQKDATLLHGTSDAYLYDKVTALDTAKFAMRFAKPETVAKGDSMTLLAANDTLRDMAAETKQNAYQFTPVAGVTVDAAIRGSLAAKGGNVTYTVNENRAGKLTFGNVQWKDSGALLKRPGNITFAGAEVDTQKIHFTNVEQLKANQKMTLVSDFGSSVGTITGDHYTVGTTLHGKGKASLQGSDLIYTVETGTHKHDPEPVLEAQPQTHNVLMAMTAGMQMVKQGGDFMNKAASGLGASENTDADGSSVFAAVGGGAGRTETGSHVKTHTWNGIVAVGASRKIGSGTFQWGVFGEYGKGNYSLHNDTGRGDGDAHYAGGGLLAKWTNKHDVYTEVGVRLGRMSDKASDLLEDADGNRYGYDIHTNYYGAHLGFGKVFRYKGGRSLDVYGKYFYTKRDGADFEAGGHYSLDSVKSSVLRVGARYGTSDKRWNWYGGLAYEYEFDGKATGRADGAEIRAASIKGGSVRGELGIRMEATKTSPWKADIRLTGYAGKRRGIGGNVSVAYTF